MARIHDLILTHGRAAARELVTEGERALVDTAAAMLETEDPGIGITYSGFCLTSLPHKKLPDNERWERHSHNLTLVIEPGVLPDSQTGATRVHGVPYGSRARLIMLYLQTEAIRSNSRDVELGASMREWLKRMGIPVGGKQFRDVKEQAARISACNLTFIWDGIGGKKFMKDTIVSGGIQLFGLEEDASQPRLWVDTVRLSDTFFQELKQRPVPVAEAAIKGIANHSAAIDTYIWLAYRLHSLTKPTRVSWLAVHSQFGGGYARVRDFKKRFAESLQLAMAVYPDGRVDVDDDGLTLHPSPPPVLPKAPRAIK